MTENQAHKPRVESLDSLRDHEYHPEPCFLTPEDLQLPVERIPRRKRPQNVATDEPRRWVNVLFDPGDVLEFRLIPPRRLARSLRPKTFMQTKTAIHHDNMYRWALADEIEVLTNNLALLNRATATWWGVLNNSSFEWEEIEKKEGIPLNIYASANPRMVAGLSKNEDVPLARSLFVDMENISVNQALEDLTHIGLPYPSLIVVSGNGVHLYWRLLEPITDLRYWTRLQKRLISICKSDPAIHDPARVMRVPGFNNVNGPSPTLCYIHDADPARRYALNDLLPLLPPDPTKKSKTSIARTLYPNVEDNNLSVHGEESDGLWRAEAYAARFEPVEENRNSTAFSRSCSLVESFGLDAKDVLPLMEKVNDKANDPLDANELKEVVEKAVKHVRKKGKPRGTAISAPARIEPYREPTGPIVKLEDWQQQMKKTRLESLGHTGKVFFDGSTTGAGKSTADLTAMRKAGQSAVFLPTHDACKELEKKLNEDSLSAAAHPPLDSSTCEKFGTKTNPGPAQYALKSGLNVGLCVCTTCDKAKVCEFQKKRELARNADHSIATHARASLSDFQPADGKPVVFIHEDVVDMLRPMVKLVRCSAKSDVPQCRHLLDILRIATAAEQIATGWDDDGAIHFARRLKEATTELIAVLDSPDLVKPFEDAAKAGRTTVGLRSARTLPLRPNIARHVQIDYLLRRAMDTLNIHSNGPALKLALAYSLGELNQLCAVVDEIKVKGGKPSFTKAIVGVWKVELPNDSVVWIENASTDLGTVKTLVGRDVIDNTPDGRLAYKVPPLQYYDADITQGTSGNKVRSVVRGLLS